MCLPPACSSLPHHSPSMHWASRRSRGPLLAPPRPPANLPPWASPLCRRQRAALHCAASTRCTALRCPPLPPPPGAWAGGHERLHSESRGGQHQGPPAHLRPQHQQPHHLCVPGGRPRGARPGQGAGPGSMCVCGGGGEGGRGPPHPVCACASVCPASRPPSARVLVCNLEGWAVAHYGPCLPLHLVRARGRARALLSGPVCACALVVSSHPRPFPAP